MQNFSGPLNEISREKANDEARGQFTRRYLRAMIIKSSFAACVYKTVVWKLKNQSTSFLTFIRDNKNRLTTVSKASVLQHESFLVARDGSLQKYLKR